MALDNCVFLSLDNYKQFQNILQLHEVHVQINNIVFYARPEKQCDNGHIMMNAIQRKQSRASLIGQVTVQPYFVNPQKDYFLEPVQLIINPRSKPQFTQIDTDELNKQLQQKLNQRPMYYDAPVVFQYNDITFEATLKPQQETNINNYGVKIITQQSEFQFQLGMAGNDLDLTGEHKQGLVLKDSPLLQFVKKSIKNLEDGKSLDDSELQLDITDIGIGGLNEQFSTIFRRLFLPRLIPPQITKQLKLQVPKGLLMYGPAGTGKTLTARKIGELLNCKSCKLVSGPEILNSYVGKSEENIRNLFTEAEKDYEENGADAGLHLIILDELDAICKQRGSKADNTGVGDSVVNQLLAKMDGVNEVQNFIVIGMTNRRDLIDSALLRPGRFEVQMEINLPDLKGREEIFEIQLRGIKASQYLSQDVNIHELAEHTPNYSGAEIKGVVNGAMSYAESRMIHQQLRNEQNAQYSQQQGQLTLNLTQKDLLRAVDDIEPQFGRSQHSCNFQRLGWLHNANFDKIVEDSLQFCEFILNSKNLNSATILLKSNTNGTGCSSIAQEISQRLQIDFVKIIEANNLIQTCSSDNAKVDKIIEVFQQAEKVQQAIIIIDSIEDIIQLSGNGIRYSNIIVSTLTTLLKRLVEKGKIIIIGTTNKYDTLMSIDAIQGWQKQYSVDKILRPQYEEIIKERCGDQTVNVTIEEDSYPLKDLLTIVEMAKEN